MTNKSDVFCISKHVPQINKDKVLESPSHSKHGKTMLKSNEFLEKRISESRNARVLKKQKSNKGESIERLKTINKTKDLVLSFYSTAYSIIHIEETHNSINNKTKDHFKKINTPDNKIQDHSKGNIEESECIVDKNDLEDSKNVKDSKVPIVVTVSNDTLEVKSLVKPLQKSIDGLSVRHNVDQIHDPELIDENIELVLNKLVYSNQETYYLNQRVVN